MELQSEIREERIDNTVSVLTQVIMQAFKTTRQVNYKPKCETNEKTFYGKRKTPLNVGLGPLLHQSTRSMGLINHLSELSLCMSYEKVRCIQTAMAESVAQRTTETDGVYIPPLISPVSAVYFAIDNIDFKNDTRDGKGEFHGTSSIVYQTSYQTSDPAHKPELITLDRNKKQSRCHKGEILEQVIYCQDPRPRNDTHKVFKDSLRLDNIEVYQTWDTSWFLMRSLQENDGQVPTWNAYNSLISTDTPVTAYSGLPLLYGSPTDWSDLYTALWISQNISTQVSPGR